MLFLFGGGGVNFVCCCSVAFFCLVNLFVNYVFFAFLDLFFCFFCDATKSFWSFYGITWSIVFLLQGDVCALLRVL